MKLIKGQNGRDPFYKAVEEVAQDLELRIKNIINSQQGGISASATDISPARVMSFLFVIVPAYKTLPLLFIEELVYYCCLRQKNVFATFEDSVEN